jgi:hypothetical protein
MIDLVPHVLQEVMRFGTLGAEELETNGSYRKSFAVDKFSDLLSQLLDLCVNFICWEHIGKIHFDVLQICFLFGYIEEGVQLW